MKALVVYDSFFGNTEKIAQAIGDALADVMVPRHKRRAYMTQAWAWLQSEYGSWCCQATGCHHGRVVRRVAQLR